MISWAPVFNWVDGMLPLVEKQLGDDLPFYEAFRRDCAAHGVAAAHTMLSTEGSSG
jgi:hypothetical protein